MKIYCTIGLLDAEFFCILLYSSTNSTLRRGIVTKI